MEGIQTGGPAAAADNREEVDSDNEVALPMMPQPEPDVLRQQSKMANDNPSPTGGLAWAGFGCTIFALAALCIAFSSPYWMQTYPNSFNSFQNIGLWEVCMDNYMHYKDDTQEVYSGCWWVFDRATKYWKLREWLLPPWMITCQVMVTGCLVVNIATLILAASVFLHFCPILNHEYYQTYGMFASSAMMFLIAMIVFVSATIFGVMCQDWQWMPRPDLNFLSWGYGFFIICGLAAIGAGVAFFMEAMKVYSELLRREEEYTKMTLEMSGYAPSQYTGYAPSQGGYAPSQGGYAPSQGGYAPSASSYPPGYEYKDQYGTQPSYAPSGYSQDYGLPPKA